MYGINNCDTVKKAQKWLTARQISFTFYDFKKQSLTADLLQQFLQSQDWSVLLNKRSTTFRQLPDDVKNNLTDDIIFAEVLKQPTLLKRPILQVKNALYVGFNTAQYEELFNNA
jgi:arsenate reductase